MYFFLCYKKVNKHINDGCPDPGTSTSKSTKKVCQFKGCKTAQLIPFVCPKCKKSFCIKHRLVSIIQLYNKD